MQPRITHLKMCLLLIIAACLSTATAQTSLGAFEREVRSAQGGVLVVIEDSKGEWRSAIRYLVNHESIVDMNLRTKLIVPKETPKVTTMIRKWRGWGPGPHWVLLWKDFSVLDQGDLIPEAETLADELVRAGSKNPVAELRRFLRANPDHLDAREALVMRLRISASTRTRREQVWEGKTLGVETDQTVWGPWVREVDALFSSGDWVNTNLFLSGEEDSASPLVMDLYRRRLPLVEEALRNWPYSTALWDVWTRMARISETNRIQPFLDSLVPLPGTPKDAWPPQPGRKALLKQAKKVGDWEVVRTLLWSKWETEVDSYRKLSDDIPYRMGVAWSSYLEPLMEAMLRLGEEGTAEKAMDECFSASGWRELPALSAALATRVGFKGLAARLQNLHPRSVGGMPPFSRAPKPLADRLDKHPPASFVFFSPDPNLLRTIEGLKREESLAVLNINALSLPLDGPEFSQLRDRYGWPLKFRWSLMDAKGDVLSSGTNAPGASELAKAFQDSGLPTRAESLKRFLAEYPESGEGWRALLKELRVIAEVRMSATLGTEELPVYNRPVSQWSLGFAYGNDLLVEPSSKDAKDIPENRDDEIWVDYIKALNACFRFDAWREPFQSGPFQKDAGLTTAFGNLSPSLKRAFASKIQSLEADIRRKPTDGFLWGLWVAWQEACGKRSIKAFLDEVIPLDGNPSKWPPLCVRQAYMKDCRSRKDWQGMLDVLGDSWKTLMPTSDQPREASKILNPTGDNYPPGAWQAIAEPMLEAYLAQARIAEAQTLVDTWIDRGGWPGALERASALAAQAGYTELAAKWASRVHPTKSPSVAAPASK